MKTARDLIYHSLKISQVVGLQDSANIDDNLANFALEELNQMLEQARLDDFLPSGEQKFNLNAVPSMITLAKSGTPTQLVTQDVVRVSGLYMQEGDAYLPMEEINYLDFIALPSGLNTYCFATNRNNSIFEIHNQKQGQNLLLVVATNVGNYTLDSVIDLPDAFHGWMTCELGALMLDAQKMDSSALWEKASSRKARLKRLNEKSIELDADNGRFDFNSGRYI